MGEILTMMLSGGATGLLGTLMSGGISFFKKKQANAHMLQLREMDMRELALEAQSSERQEALKLEAAMRKGSYADARTFISKNMKLTNGQKWIVVFIDLIRGLMRPVITIFFLVMTYLLYRQGQETQSIESAIIYMTTTTVLWWFGTRQLEKQDGKAK